MSSYKTGGNGSVYLDTSELLARVGKLENYGKILSPAMSKTKGKFKTELSRNIREMYNIKAGDASAAISVNYRTAPPNITATVKGRRFTLGRFLVGNFKPGKPVKVRVLKGRTSSLASPTFANTITGQRQVARRVGSSRLPIEVLRTVSVAQMAERNEVYNKTLDNVGAELFKQIDAQHKRFFGGK